MVGFTGRSDYRFCLIKLNLGSILKYRFYYYNVYTYIDHHIQLLRNIDPGNNNY